MENKTFLGRYRVSLDRNGLPIDFRRGPAGVTYRAENIESSESVTLELVDFAAVEDTERARAEKEAGAARSFSHVNVARLLDFGVDGDQLVYVSEYLEGTPLDSWVRTHGPLPAGAVLRVALQVVSALGGAAFHQITHRAIQPANLMIVPGQTAEGDWPLVKVLNFGRVAPTFATDKAHLLPEDSAKYASPEQLRGEPVDFRSAIYSLGASLLFLLTGSAPFATPGDPLGLRQSRKSIAVERFGDVPKVLRRLVMQMLAPDPNDRPQDPLALEEQINNGLSRVERRQAFDRKPEIAVVAPAVAAVSLAPAPVAAAEPSRYGIPFKPLAIAAILIGLLALAAFALPARLKPSWFRQAQTEAPIGVPVGIPEAQAEAVAVVPPPAPDGAASGEIAPSTMTSSPKIASTQSNSLPAETVPPVTSPQKVEPSPAVAANGHAPVVEPAVKAPVIASTNFPSPANKNEPPPPAEGPAEVAPDYAVAEQQPDAAANSTKRQQFDVTSEGPWADSMRNRAEQHPVETVKKSQDNIASVAKSELKNQKRRVAKVGPGRKIPRAQSGSMQARFLGTTPDGRWVLALPSGRTILAEPPPGADTPGAPPPRRLRRAVIDPAGEPPPWFAAP